MREDSMPNRILCTTLAAGLALAVAACGPSGDPEEFARQQAQEQRADNPPAVPAVKVETPVPGGKKLACEDLIDLEAFGAALGEEELTVSDRTHTETDPTAVCSIVKGGKMLDAVERERLIKKTNKLGTLAGDEICNVTLYCSFIADEATFEQQCRDRNDQSNKALGVFSCVRVTMRGPKDAYTYRFIHPATKCTFQVRGGPSVVDESLVQTCAKTAMDTITAEHLRNYK
jgi:hypothetical protein